MPHFFMTFNVEEFHSLKILMPITVALASTLSEPFGTIKPSPLLPKQAGLLPAVGSRLLISTPHLYKKGIKSGIQLNL